VLHLVIEDRLRAAVAAVLPEADLSSVQVRPCPDPKFGDYQSNALMGLAKQLRMNPRQLAEQVRGRLDVETWCEPVEIAGAGFLNFRLKLGALAAHLTEAAAGAHLFFKPASAPRTYVIDFSSPNVAKPMHVGHIRSTVLGDALARTLRLLGHRVVTDNHIGDWGTQFGKLIVGWKRSLDPEALARDAIGEMERLYKLVNAACEAEPATLELARQELVKLQAGDEENLALWRRMIELSQRQFDGLYGRLGVVFDHTYGESFYNPRLQGVVAELRARGLATESDGAMCVFSDGTLPPKDDPLLIQREGKWEPNPCLVLKSDGAANYATTDLATLQYRVETWHPEAILYVTDGRQQLHFRQFFHVFRRWHPESTVRLAHIWFGSILGEDGKPFKTRSGETVKLAELLDEAEERAYGVVTQKNPELEEARRREVARVVGLGAVKYADLLPNRQSDYVFSWDKMLSLQGNTAPYLQYAYARTCSLLRKAEPGYAGVPAGGWVLTSPDEIALAKQLLLFGLTLEAMAEEGRPNYLCNYLYELAGRLARFWESCQVLKTEEPVRSSRLALCDLTGKVLRTGLRVLGIETLEQM
jgi:arginyl-tRNA synthetase